MDNGFYDTPVIFVPRVKAKSINLETASFSKTTNSKNGLFEIKIKNSGNTVNPFTKSSNSMSNKQLTKSAKSQQVKVSKIDLRCSDQVSKNLILKSFPRERVQVKYSCRRFVRDKEGDLNKVKNSASHVSIFWLNCCMFQLLL